MAGSLITDVGLTKLSSATPLDQLNVTSLAVGDGNGGFPTLSSSMTNLTNEVWRGTVTNPIRDPENENILIFEAYIPSDVGGFTIREQGIFDEDGDMIAIGHTAEISKPDPASSVGVVVTMRMHIALSSSEDVDLIYTDTSATHHNSLTNRDDADSHPASAISRGAGNVEDVTALPYVEGEQITDPNQYYLYKPVSDIARLVRAKYASSESPVTMTSTPDSNFTTDRARIFETLTELQSAEFTNGDMIVLRERANAQYIVQSSGYTALEGDITLSSGQVLDLQLQAVNDVRWWGVIDDMDYDLGTGTDNTEALQSAIKRGSGYSTHQLACGGEGLIGIGSTVKVDRGYINLRLNLFALDSFDAGDVQLPDDWENRTHVTDIYDFELDSYTGRLARGNPMVRATYVDIPSSLGYTKESDYSHCFFDLVLDGRDVAPCYYQEKLFNSTILRLSCKRQKYYGAAFLTKNGQCRVLSLSAYEFVWGSDKYYGTEERTSIGVYISSNDMIFESVISYYSAIPVYFGRVGAIQISSWHIFNGPTSRHGAFYSARSNTVFSNNLYIDGVDIALMEYNHSFVQNYCLDHENETPFKVYANSSTAQLMGLNITNTGIGSDSNGVCSFVEENGNLFTRCRGTNIEKPHFIEDNDPTRYVPYKSYLDKDIRLTLSSSNWVALNDIYYQEVSLSNYLALVNSNYSNVIRVSTLLRSSDGDVQSSSDLPSIFIKHDVGNKILTFYSTVPDTLTVDFKLEESTVN